MSPGVHGVVQNGLIVPSTPLPEGAEVDIYLREQPSEVPPDLQEELAAWQRAQAQALDLVERLAGEGAGNEPG